MKLNFSGVAKRRAQPNGVYLVARRPLSWEPKRSRRYLGGRKVLGEAIKKRDLALLVREGLSGIGHGARRQTPRRQ